MNITLELPIATAKRLEKLGEENFFNFLIKKLLQLYIHLCYNCLAIKGKEVRNVRQ